jgi:predicted DNA-binding ribbon-helix-helix protein
MCRIFAHQDPSNYAFETRSLRIGGHSTSVRLETLFWTTLEGMAASQGMSLGKFMTTLSEEVLERHGSVRNFASLLRCSCLLYLQAGQGAVAQDAVPPAHRVAPAA